MSEQAHIEEGVTYTIKEWCAAERQSAATFHKLQRMGVGPQTIKVPGTHLVRIIESRESWHRRMLAMAEERKAKQERQRRSQQSAEAVNRRWERERALAEKRQAKQRGKRHAGHNAAR
jgi:hypothetical protein